MADPQSEPLKPGQPGFVNPPVAGPSTIHPAQRELDAPDNWPHSVPVVMERISNSYFGRVVDADFTAAHGTLYSIEGVPHSSLGNALAWCVKNPKPTALPAAEPVAGGMATSPAPADDAPAAAPAPTDDAAPEQKDVARQEASHTTDTTAQEGSQG